MRTYIAPNKTGEIAGIKVKALSLQKRIIEHESPCVKCVIKEKNICFKDVFIKEKGIKIIKHKQLDTRPACFGNDPENLRHVPVYYVKA